MADVSVRGGLVFIGAEVGLFTSPFAVDGVWVGWDKAIRTRLRQQSSGTCQSPRSPRCSPGIHGQAGGEARLLLAAGIP